MRSISRVIPLVIVATVRMVGVGIGVVVAPHGPKEAPCPAAAAITSHVASSAQWAAQGTRLVRGVFTNGKGTYNSTYKNGNWAYGSMPVDAARFTRKWLACTVDG